MIAWHKHPAKMTERVYCNIEGGKKIAMPRYYKQRLYHEGDKFRIAIDVSKNLQQLDDITKMHSNLAKQKSYEFKNRSNKATKI